MNLMFFLRCVETIVALSGMIISIAAVHKQNKLRLLVSAAIMLLSCSLLSVVYTTLGKGITEKLFFPILVVSMVMLTYIITSDRIWVTLFNSLSQLVIYRGISMVCDTVVRHAALPSAQSDLLYLLLRLVLFTIIIFSEVKFIRKPFRHLVDVARFEWYIATLAVFLFSILVVAMTIYPVMYYDRPVYAQIEVILAYALMAVVFYVFNVAFRNIIQKTELQKSDLLMKEKVEYMEKDKEISKTDPLTGVLNRRSFQEQIIQNLTSEQNSALLILDIDDFKKINDRFGHDVGDDALKALSDALTGSFRSIDIIARLGGDEFIVLLNHIKKNDESILKRILVFKQNLQQILQSRNLPSFSVSIGIAYTNGDSNFTRLYKNADMAMYESKDNGKDRSFFYTEEQLV